MIDEWQIVFRARNKGSRINGKVYHTDGLCGSLKNVVNIRKTRLGAMIAGKYKKHC